MMPLANTMVLPVGLASSVSVSISFSRSTAAFSAIIRAAFARARAAATSSRALIKDAWVELPASIALSVIFREAGQKLGGSFPGWGR